MDIEEFIKHFRNLGVNLWLEEDNLRYTAPKGILTSNLKSELVLRKTDIVAFLRKAGHVVNPSLVSTISMSPPKSTLPFTAPSTSIEKVLVSIWSQVLGVKQIRVDDNFFECGGDSLSVMQVIARANQAGLTPTPLQLFENQTILELAAVLDAPQATLEESGINSQVPPIVPLDREGILPLSFAQQRLWILDQLEPDGASAYTVPMVSRLTGLLNVKAFKRALAELMRRHEILRTTFAMTDGQLVQVIEPHTAFPLVLIDLCNTPETEREEQAHQLIENEIRQSFDLARGPLCRATLINLGDEEQILAVSMHHIITDGWSVKIFQRELAQLYNAFSRGEPSPLIELPIQYVDYAAWQRGWLQGEKLEAQLTYWKQQLASVSPVLELPTDRPRLAIQTFNGARETFYFPIALSKKLSALGRQEGVTLFMLLLAGLETLLYRYTGQDDFCIGTPIAGRRRADIEGLIGLFINTLVLRAELDGDPSFVDLLKRVRQKTLEAYEHQDLPFEQLVNALGLNRDVSHSPLFQVMFAFQNMPENAGNEVEWSGLSQSTFSKADTRSTMFDLTLYVWETPKGLQGTAEYNSDLFDAATIARLLGHFQTLIEGIVEYPKRKLSELPVLTAAEREQMLVEWNGTKKEYPLDKCIHTLFEEQVERTPDKVAVVFEGQQLTYDELNRKSNQLARYLQKHGVTPETLVGICMERSVEMVVGLLGILKAGGAYVPLDPSYPQERLAFMLEDTAMPVLLTQQKFAETLRAKRRQVVSMDEDWGSISRENHDNIINDGLSLNLAYVIYTSGSTGVPKGVQILHKNVVNLLISMQDKLRLTSADNLLSVTTLSFDIAGLELFLPLTAGATVIVASREEMTDGYQLLKKLAEGAVTIMQATPATWQMLLLAGWEGTPSLKMLCGGDTMPRELAQQLLSRETNLWNVYGPTETTIWSMAYKVVSGDGLVPIGCPIANTQIYLLDSKLQPVPIGVPGELYIGGVGLGRGYLNRPELNQEKFIINPFSDEQGARLYKTGDLARYLPDGNITFLGRSDYQVKIRGFRIELGEIETVLARYPEIREIAVIVREDYPGEKRLVAYLVSNQKSLPSISELRAYVAKRVPDYMIPSLFVFMTSLPLTPNGKLDRKALPVPDYTYVDMSNEYVVPGTLIEETLAKIWSEVLRVERVGISDNFFELGGDSLLAIRVVARAHQAGLHFTPHDFFQHQTIAELVTQCQLTVIQKEQAVVTGLLPLTVTQKKFISHKYQHPNRWNVPMLFVVPAGTNPQIVEQVVRYLWAYHDGLRTHFVDTEAGWRQLVAPIDENKEVPFTYIDFSSLPAEKHINAIEHATNELQSSLNLLEGPLMRVALFNLGAKQTGRLFIVFHHLVFDEVSSFFYDDFFSIFQQLNCGVSAQLPAKTTPFWQWVERLNAYTQSPELYKELDYWLSLPWAEIHPLPLDYPDNREKNTSESVRSVAVLLSLEETEVLVREISKAYDVQVIDVLITALVEATTKWSGSRWSIYGSIDFGRNAIPNATDLDLSRTIGWFGISRQLVLQRDDNRSPKEMLKLIQGQLQRIPNRGLGHELLLYGSEDKDVVEKLQSLPQSEILLNYVGRQAENTKFQVASENMGPAHDPRDQRNNILDCSISISQGCLVTYWGYSKNLHKRATIKKVAQDYIQWLQMLITQFISSLPDKHSG